MDDDERKKDVEKRKDVEKSSNNECDSKAMEDDDKENRLQRTAYSINCPSVSREHASGTLRMLDERCEDDIWPYFSGGQYGRSSSRERTFFRNALFYDHFLSVGFDAYRDENDSSDSDLFDDILTFISGISDESDNAIDSKNKELRKHDYCSPQPSCSPLEYLSSYISKLELIEEKSNHQNSKNSQPNDEDDSEDMPAKRRKILVFTETENNSKGMPNLTAKSPECDEESAYLHPENTHQPLCSENQRANLVYSSSKSQSPGNPSDINRNASSGNVSYSSKLIDNSEQNISSSNMILENILSRPLLASSDLSFGIYFSGMSPINASSNRNTQISDMSLAASSARPSNSDAYITDRRKDQMTPDSNACISESRASLPSVLDRNKPSSLDTPYHSSKEFLGSDMLQNSEKWQSQGCRPKQPLRHKQHLDSSDADVSDSASDDEKRKKSSEKKNYDRRKRLKHSKNDSNIPKITCK